MDNNTYLLVAWKTGDKSEGSGDWQIKHVGAFDECRDLMVERIGTQEAWSVIPVGDLVAQ